MIEPGTKVRTTAYVAGMTPGRIGTVRTAYDNHGMYYDVAFSTSEGAPFLFIVYGHEIEPVAAEDPQDARVADMFAERGD